MAAYESYSIPDDLWAKFLADEIHHFTFDDAARTGTAVYADGREEMFSAAVTPEMREEERRRRIEVTLRGGGQVYPVKMTAKIDFASSRGYIHNSGG